MTFLLGYWALVYVASQFINEARHRCEDLLTEIGEGAVARERDCHRAFRDFCGAYTLIIGLSVLLFVGLIAENYLEATKPCRCCGGERSSCLWLYLELAAVFLTTAFVVRHFCLEWSELTDLHDTETAVCDSRDSLSGVPPTSFRRRLRRAVCVGKRNNARRKQVRRVRPWLWRSRS